MDLLERSAELQLLRRVIEDTRFGRGGCVLIESEAGGGKTAFIRAALEQAGAQLPQLRIHQGMCEALHTPRPLGPLVDLCAELPQDISTLLHAGRVDSGIFPAFLDYLRQAAPVILVVEDLHWADGATLDLLKHAARRIAEAGVVIIGSYRYEELAANPALLQFLGDVPANTCHRLTLSPLSRAAVARLAAGTRQYTEALFKATGGNPFFVTEVLRDSAGNTVPVSVRDAVLARVARLGANARTICEWVSLTPNRMELWLLQALVPDLNALDECTARGVLLVDQAAVCFRHDLARRAIAASLSSSLRQRRNQVIFLTLQERGGSAPARLLHHAEQAGLSDAIATLGPLAARAAAAAGAYREQADLLKLVLVRCDAVEPRQRGALLEAYIEACARVGKHDEGRSAALEAMALYRLLSDRQAEGRVLVSAAYFGRGGGEALQFLAQARDILQQLPATPPLVVGYALTAFNTLRNAPKEALDWAHKAVSLAHTLGDPTCLAHALDALGTVELAMDYSAASIATCEQALQYALSHSSSLDVASIYTSLTTEALRHLDYPRLLDYAARSLAYMLERDLDAWVGTIVISRARGLIDLGRWSEADQDLNLLLNYRHYPLKLTRGSNTPVYADQQQTYGAALAAVLDMRRCRAEPGYWAAVMERPHQMAAVRLAAFRAEASFLVGDFDALTKIVVDYLPAATATNDPWAVANLVVWLARAQRPQPATAVELPLPVVHEFAGEHAAAAQRWAQLQRPYERAMALLGGADAELRQALTTFNELGASVAAAIARARLRAVGAHVQRGPYRAAHEDPLGLTARQRQVLELVLQGCSNREVANRMRRSVRTVDNHVTAIFGKLEVNSRDELRRRLADLGH